MMTIEETVIQDAVRQDNGRWIFEGKDTHSWFGEAEAYRAAYSGQMSLDRSATLDELYAISAALQRLDNYEENEDNGKSKYMDIH